MPKRIVVVSAHLAPLHRGHIEYFTKAKALGDILIVIVNSDEQARIKHNHSFMSCKDRIEVARALECVDMAVEAIDKDQSVCETLRMLHPHVFANGGDRTNDNIPEAEICREMGIELVDGLGEKIESSSWLIENARRADYMV